MSLKVERAGVAFEFSFYDDSDERGRAVGFDLEGFELIDAEEFTAETGQKATPENVAAFVKAHENEMGEKAVEEAAEIARDDCDPDDDEPEEYTGP